MHPGGSGQLVLAVTTVTGCGDIDGEVGQEPGQLSHF